MGLDPIDFPMAFTHHFADVPGAHFFAATDHYVVSGIGRPVFGEYESAFQAMTEGIDPSKCLLQLPATLRRDRVVVVFEQGEGGAFAGHFRRVGAHDAGAITGQINLGDTAATGAVALRQPGAVERVPGECAAEQIRQLGFAAQAVGEGHGITVQRMLAA